jgi:hypothetical protein
MWLRFRRNCPTQANDGLEWAIRDVDEPNESSEGKAVFPED